MRATRIRGEVIFRSNEVWLMWLNSAKTRSELSTKNPCGWIVTGPRTTSIVAENQWLEDWKMEISQLKMIPFLGTCQFLFVERFPPGGFELVAFVAMGSPPLILQEAPTGHGTRNQQTFLECTCEGAGSWGAAEIGAGGGGGGGGGGFGKQWGGGIGA